jgi:predicted DNA-binding transcriptional regulator YafY
MLVLQTRGQLTAVELAERLEVSERTVQRDAQALAEAGVPIVSVRGPAGGYRLERGYRTKLTGLDVLEAEALFVGPAAELGLGRELAAARLKLLASLPAELQERADRAARLFHLDTRGWFREEDRVPHLPVIAGALWRGRRLDMRYREGATVVSRRLDPLGLILKAGVWYLLARRRGEERVYRVSRIVSARERAEQGWRPRDFDLAAAWASRSEAFERSRTPIEVTVRVRRDDVRYLRAARIVENGEPPTVIAQFDGLGQAFRTLIAYGAEAEVLAPRELRERIATAAAETAALYAAGSLGEESTGMSHTGDIGTEIAPEVADDPELAARLDDLLHRTCSLARALAHAEQSALSVDLDGDGRAARKFFSLSARYERWRDFRAEPRGLGLHSIQLEPGEVVRLTQDEVEAHPLWTGFGETAGQHQPLRGLLAAPVCGGDGRHYGLLQLSDKSDGGEFTAEDEERIRELAAFAGATLDALRAARR